ncbi:MAG: hypothetical protein LV473_00815 [Nitrospira sp.]|nr:hypothetical protein [Nitrospira sp.]
MPIRRAKAQNGRQEGLEQAHNADALLFAIVITVCALQNTVKVNLRFLVRIWSGIDEAKP